MTTLAILLLTTTHMSTAQAATTEGLLIGGAAAITIPVAIDTLNWGLVPDRDHALAWHLVPVAGPIVGLRANARMPCDDPKHGCTMQRGLFTIMDSLALASEVAGVAMVTTALLRPDAALTVSPSSSGVRLQLSGQW